jgi:hypothetical protein
MLPIPYSPPSLPFPFLNDEKKKKRFFPLVTQQIEKPAKDMNFSTHRHKNGDSSSFYFLFL